jgi:hypothetical protein
MIARLKKTDIPADETDRTHARRDSDLFFLFFAAGAIAGLAGMHGIVPFGKGFEMCALAQNLAANGNYANPFGVLATGPTAANPPLYPLILATYIKLFHGSSLVFLAAVVGNLIANALSASLLLRVSKSFFNDIRPGIMASLFWMASVELMPAWDVSFTVALLLLFILATHRMTAESGGWGAAVVNGALAGALFLLNPSTILVVLPWVAYLQLSGTANWRRLLGNSVLLVAVLSIVAFGWAFRNRLQLGSFVERTNFGMTIYASNNDCARPSLVANEENNCYQAHHPNTSLAEAQLLQSMGEPAYDRMRTEDTKAWIRSHRAAFLSLSFARLRDFWFPPIQGHPFKTLVIWLATALSVPGIFMMARQRMRLTLCMASVLFFYPLLYYVVVSDVRYRYPVLWLSLLPAGYLLRKLVPIHSETN